MKVKRYYTHYLNWEDWQNGMYRDIVKSEFDKYVKLAIECLRNPYDPMFNVTKEWYNSSYENLSDYTSNRKSWLGQAACCYNSKVPEQCTRHAWGLLTEKERQNANNIAKQVIQKWENNFYPNLFSTLQESE